MQGWIEHINPYSGGKLRFFIGSRKKFPAELKDENEALYMQHLKRAKFYAYLVERQLNILNFVDELLNSPEDTTVIVCCKFVDEADALRNLFMSNVDYRSKFTAHSVTSSKLSKKKLSMLEKFFNALPYEQEFPKPRVIFATQAAMFLLLPLTAKTFNRTNLVVVDTVLRPIKVFNVISKRVRPYLWKNRDGLYKVIDNDDTYLKYFHVDNHNLNFKEGS